MSFIALLLTFLSGLFFFIGFWFVKRFQQKKNFQIFGVGLALTIMLGMIFFDLVPEIIEISNQIMLNKWVKIVLILLFVFLGIGILSFLDRFLPAHHHEHHDNEKNVKEHHSHQYHIGMILAFSLILHNFLEGMSLYLIAKESLTSGILMMMGIGLHNLPLGMEIKSSMDELEKKRKSKILLPLVFSSFMGGFLLFLIGGIPDFVSFTLFSIALGMILYLSLFELLHEVMGYHKNKMTFLGIGCGLLLLMIMNFLG